MSEIRRILEDDPSEAERALLGSARFDAPTASSKARVLAALGLAAATTTAGTTGAATAGAGASLALKWVVIGAIGGSAVTWVAARPSSPSVSRSVANAAPVASLVLQPRTEPPGALVSAIPSVQPEPTAPEPPTQAFVTSVPFAAASAARPSPHAEPSLVAPSPTQPARLPEPRPKLAAEVSALGEASRALASDQAGAALGLLDAFDQRFAHPTLAPEATVLRIETLLALGRGEEARGLARGMLAAQPDSPYAQRVRSLLGATAAGIP